MTNTAALETTTILAEEAPIGVQLWPTRSPEFAPNFTLAEVIVVRKSVRDQYGTVETVVVTWVYENGNVRTFSLGEEVVCQIEN